MQNETCHFDERKELKENDKQQKLNFMKEIKVLGTGCSKCKTLEKMVRTIVEQHGIEAELTKVEDVMEIIKYGVMTTPALVVDGVVVLKGRVPSLSEVESLLVGQH